MVFSKEVNSSEFNTVYLKILNGLLHLTEKEIAVLAEFMKFSEIDSVTRVIVQDRLNLSQFSLNNYIKALKDKRVLTNKDDKITVNPTIMPSRSRIFKDDKYVTEITFKLIEDAVRN